MADSKITFDSSTGYFEAGLYLRMAGGPWWKTCWLIVSVDSETTMTVRWEWWREPWFQMYVILGLLWANLFVWSGWNASL